MILVRIAFLLLSAVTLINSAIGQKELKQKLFFDSKEYKLKKSHQAVIDDMLSQVKNGVHVVRIIGHTDSIGSTQSNLNLSEKRTSAVVEYFKTKGYEEDKMIKAHLGETSPPFLNRSKDEWQKNRCVEIVITFSKDDKIASNNLDSKEKPEKEVKFENDTIIYTDGGAQILINAGTFYPNRISDIRFDINEVYSNCDIYRNSSSLQTVDGDCLASAGMIFIKPTLNSVEVQPNEGQLVTIKLPMINGKADKKMEVYFETIDKQGQRKWKLKKSQMSYEEGAEKFYVFKVDSLLGINLDKSLGVVCEKNGPRIKIKKYNSISVCQTYPDEVYLSRGAQVKRKIFAIDEVVFDKNPQIIILAYDKQGYPVVAERPLNELKYKKRKNIYVAKRQLFKRKLFDRTKERIRMEDILC